MPLQLGRSIISNAQIVWLRRDLRLVDQAAFCAAAEHGPVIPVYVLDDETPIAGGSDRRLGGAARWWLHHSLQSLADDLGLRGSKLILRRGRAADEIARLAQETGAKTVHALHHYEPWWRAAEEELAARLDLSLQDGNFLLPPGTISTGSGMPYKIFTPFRDAMFAAIDGFDILPEPSLATPDQWPASDDLSDWQLLPTKPDWAGGFGAFWEVGTAAALDRFDDFVEQAPDYDTNRNMPALDGSSRMSPHLHWGEVSPRMLWERLAGDGSDGASSFRSELVWRDYAQNLVRQFPDYPEKPYRDGYGENFWRDPAQDSEAAEDLRAWQQGRTGYPIVDAGMRQLWHTGWMHNRVRMIAASFLVKHLLIDWRHGDRWFWDTLVDADYANNGTNWQWVAGTGVDANMFVRIMAPLSQSAKFDAGDYIRQYVPPLAHLSDEHIHDPSAEQRPNAYPDKRIGHKQARERALATYRSARDG